MSDPASNHKELLSALDQLFSKYFEEKDGSSREKTPQDKFWGTYLRAMKDEDEARPKDWDGNTGSILTFTGLFAATVAAFLIESYTLLSPDPGDQTVTLITQLLAVTANSTTSVQIGISSSDAFQAPTTAVILNALWFCSLAVTLACALLATLVQQWSRDYVRSLRQRDTLNDSLFKRATNHAYIYMGVDRYGMDQVVDVLVALVHLSVFLFAGGLLLFLFPVNSTVALCTLSTLGLFGVAYIAAGVWSMVDDSCPYVTPLTYTPDIVYWVSTHIYDNLMRIQLLLLDHDFVYHALRWMHSIYDPAADVTGLRRAGKTLRRWRWRLTSWWQLSKMNKLLRRWRHTDTDHEVLSVSCFEFIWEHTSHQMLDVDLKTLLQSTMGILGSNPQIWQESFAALMGLEVVECLHNDERLMERLHDFVREVQDRLIDSPDPSTLVAVLQMTCLMLDRVSRLDAPSLLDEGNDAIFRYIEILHFVVGILPDNGGDDQRFLQLRYCIFHMRWSLLLQARKNIIDSQNLSSLTVSLFSKQPESNHYIGWVIFGSNDTYCNQAWAPLLFLNSWQYNLLDAAERRDARGDWSDDMSSCLVPLHDDSCCTARDGPWEHIAASAVLTMIAHLLRAPETERDELLENHLQQYSRLWEHALPFHNWNRIFEMSDVDRRRAPSREFLQVLHDAGLDVWLDTVDDRSYLPPSTTQQGRFLAYNDSMFAGVLRTLIIHVDMSKIRSDFPESHRWLPQTHGAQAVVPGDERQSNPWPVSVASGPLASGNVLCDSGEAKTGSTHPVPALESNSFELERVVIDDAFELESHSSSRPSKDGPSVSASPTARKIDRSDDEDGSDRSRGLSLEQPLGTEPNGEDGAQTIEQERQSQGIRAHQKTTRPDHEETTEDIDVQLDPERVSAAPTGRGTSL
ncbi:hypothetical protein PENSPDRAFT_756695 [Peniophora sp. CONT]|nr:hypothetical protein PENSPDRAFT_756695 [Peniophora sp. CONT]